MSPDMYHPWYALAMTETAPAAPATDYAEIMLCPDCAIVIANGDASGIEDADTHLAAMDAHLTGYAFVACSGETCDETCGGFRTETCGGCGSYTATDGWHLGMVEVPAA